MADADHATCSRSGASVPVGDASGLCPQCLQSAADGTGDDAPLVAQSTPGHARRKPRLAAAIAAGALVLLGAVWYGNRPDDQRAERSVHFKRGDILVDQGKLDEAILEFREAIRIDPELAEAHVYLGTILGHQRKLDEAAAEFREAIRIDPGLAEAHAYLGKILGHQGKLNEAAAHLRQAIRLKPNRALAHYQLATTLGAQGNLEKATAEFRMAIRLRPGDVEAHYQLGNTLQARGKLNEAVDEYREVVRLEPDHARAHYNLGVALHRQGKVDDAMAEYRAAIKIKPDDVIAHYTLATALSEQGKADQSIDAYREAIRIKPDLAPAHGHLARALVLPLDRPRRDYDEGLVHARKAVELAPKDGFSYATLALAEYRLGHWRESLAASETALALGPRGNPSCSFLLALAQWQTGEKNSAREWFNRAATGVNDQNARNATVRQLWAEAAALLGEPGPDGVGTGERPATILPAEQPH